MMRNKGPQLLLVGAVARWRWPRPISCSSGCCSPSRSSLGDTPSDRVAATGGRRHRLWAGGGQLLPGRRPVPDRRAGHGGVAPSARHAAAAEGARDRGCSHRGARGCLRPLRARGARADVRRHDHHQPPRRQPEGGGDVAQHGRADEHDPVCDQRHRGGAGGLVRRGDVHAEPAASGRPLPGFPASGAGRRRAAANRRWRGAVEPRPAQVVHVPGRNLADTAWWSSWTRSTPCAPS